MVLQMAPEVFTQEWVDAWCAALNASDAYREAAAGWEGAVALVMSAERGGSRSERAVFLDVSGGRCHGARVARAGDVEAARYVIEAAPDAWRMMLGGELAPLMALMTGKLRLTRGDFASLLPYANAAKELVVVATAIPFRFPEDSAGV